MKEWKLEKARKTLEDLNETVQNAQKPHPAGLENTAILQIKIKITEIPQEKLSNTAIPQTPMSPSYSHQCIVKLTYLQCKLENRNYSCPVVSKFSL